MSVGKFLSSTNDDIFVIPFAGKMFKSSTDSGDKALVFVLNKGYFQVNNLSRMLELRDAFIDDPDLICVGNINKIRLSKSREIVYRQRVFIKNISSLMKLCKKFGLYVRLDNNFRVTINSVMNCIEEARYLERYARKFNQTIDTYLTNCYVVWMHFLLQSYRMHSPYAERVEQILQGREGYMERAPFLCGRYSVAKHISSIMLCQPDEALTDMRCYTHPIYERTELNYGYLDSLVQEDVKGGVLK